MNKKVLRNAAALFIETFPLENECFMIAQIPNQIIREHHEEELEKAKAAYVDVLCKLEEDVTFEKWLPTYESTENFCCACRKPYGFRDVKSVKVCCIPYSMALLYNPVEVSRKIDQIYSSP